MMFRTILFLKSDLDQIMRDNKLKGVLYRKYYLKKIEKILKGLDNTTIDIVLLRGFYEFLKLTNIHNNSTFNEKYKVELSSDKNTIKIAITSEINFIITIFQDTTLNITYCEGKTRAVYNLQDNLTNCDIRDKVKLNILEKINEETLKVMVFSVMKYFELEGN